MITIIFSYIYGFVYLDPQLRQVLMTLDIILLLIIWLGINMVC